MKQKIKLKSRGIIVILMLALCVSMLFGAFMLNNSFSATSASADSTTSSIEDVLTFTLFNNGTEYRVKARNKTITEANIPAKYNGLPVTEISDNGFLSCTKLTFVRVPNSVTKVGNNAFYNCSNLETLTGMSRVQTIGDNAFANCKKLDDIILPSTINKLGKTILKGNSNTVYSRKSEEEMSSLNQNWRVSTDSAEYIYGNDLVLKEVYDETNKLQGYALYQEQNLELPDVDFVLGDTYKGEDLVEIASEAFANCTFNSFTLKHGEIIPDASDMEGEAPVTLNLEDEECNHTVNIAEYAFLCMTANYIDLLVDITFINYENDGNILEFEDGYSYSDSVFSCCYTLQKITLPINIDIIPNNAFNGCDELSEICFTDSSVSVNHISNNITSIGSGAFAGCKKIEELYIPDSVVNMGNGVFDQWGDSEVVQTIHLEDYYAAPFGEEGYNWDSEWMGTTYDNLKLEYKRINVTLCKNCDADEEDVPCGGDDSIEVMLRQDMPIASAPTREYYSFMGYYEFEDGQGKRYYDENMNSIAVNWDKDPRDPDVQPSGFVIHAYWVGKPYTITFDKNEGTGGTDSVNANYKKDMPSAIAPEKTGYHFEGYYLDIEDEDTKYYDNNMSSVKPWDYHEPATLTAKWEGNEYSVLLDNHGGQGSTSIKVTFGKEMPDGISKPVLAGYKFNGYFLNNSEEPKQYYNDDMTSANKWDIAEDWVVLYADWTEQEFKITFHYNDTTKESEKVHYHDDLPAIELNIKVAEGKEFLGFYTEEEGKGKKYYNADMSPAYFYDVEYDLHLYAYIPLIEYKITYKIDDYMNLSKNFTNPNKKSFTVEDLPLTIKPVEYCGYRVDWSVSTVNEITLNDVEIKGTVSLIVYTITYDLNGGTNNGGNRTTYTVEDSFELKDINSNRPFFDCWTLDGKMIWQISGMYGNITLKAIWSLYKTIHIRKEFTSMTVSDYEVEIKFDIALYNNFTINVETTTSYLGICGNGRVYGMNINIYQRNTDFTLGLDNIGIKAHSGQNAIKMSGSKQLTLSTAHAVVIKGCTYNGNGITAISCPDLWIVASGDLFIQGGNGIDGFDNPFGKAENGGCAGSGVYVSSGNVYVDMGNVTIAGGIPGKGGNGQYKGWGGSGAYPVMGSSDSATATVSPYFGASLLLIKTNNGADGTGIAAAGGIEDTNIGQPIQNNFINDTIKVDANLMPGDLVVIPPIYDMPLFPFN